MQGSTYGTLFRVTTFGESHGPAVGCVVDGCPPGLPLDLDRLQHQVDRRRPGQSKIVTPRREADRIEIVSGLFEGHTLGTPLTMIVANRDARSKPYEKWRHVYRPSHGDYTYEAKYGRRDWRGGGRASARETVARVAAGAVAEQWLSATLGIEIVAWVEAVGTIRAAVDPELVTREQVDGSPVRCPDPKVAADMRAAIEAARADRDGLGGIVRCVLRGVPPGLGEPVFDKAEARLAAAMLSIPATKGFEIGSGFAGTQMPSSRHNDPFTTDEAGRIRTVTNASGGVQAGLTTGMPIIFGVAFKPVATIPRPQQTVDSSGRPTTITMTGRHDPCVLPRAVPIVEAMAALTLIDLALLQRTRGAF